MIKPLKKSLTFTDGFNFGCGFWVAGFLFSLSLPVLVILTMILMRMLVK